ncbi:peptidylprolyl isomerase [Falsirhodobacter halotolerans]|uniref:peptidylprolyl isomerase n=1 Tax=Falsirhodobacter halotolerans TaxID=1146892 RepID=UPI001FD5F7FF|nr:peptidylprolyl isomerase [Falsirhodobacter halotolerans]MCJ8139766.1 peptidylprolyl isomerase [Falsirhodobacter halotolerans]
MQRFTPLLLAALLGSASLQPAVAQNLFAPHAIVNGSAITNWELQQRERFLTVLRAPGDARRLAEDGLIEDRLKLDAGKQMGIEVSDEELADGMEEFAGRADMNTDQFVGQLAQAGIDETTFRDFVRSGIIWRHVVRDRFSQRVIISEADIDRALENASQSPNIRVLLSELILPAPPGQEQQALNAAEDIAARVTAGESFARFAEQYSASPSAQNGGALEWLPLADLPPGLQPVFLGLSPGGVTQPLQVPNAVALFQLRQLDESAPTARATEVDYALFPLATAADGAVVRGRVDSCNDLYTVARENGVAVQRQTQATASLPADLSGTIAGLDQYESAVVMRGASLSLVMLCARRAVQENAVDRDAIRNQLTNQQLSALADVYIKQLRDNAIIRQP